MSKTIEGVPEFITREAYVAMIEDLGLDPKQIVQLRFVSGGIYATTFVVDEYGNRVFNPQTRDYEKHFIYIGVVD